MIDVGGIELTKKELSQLYYLGKEIKSDQRRLAELESKATSVTQNMTGMPGGSGSGDKIGFYATEIAQQRELIEIKLRQCIILQNKILKYINGIESSFYRQILTQRYVDCHSWTRIAINIGGNNTPDGVRMAHDRFIKKYTDVL